MLYEYFSVIDSRLADYEILLREASTLSPFPYHLDLDYGIVQIVLLMIVREKDKEVDGMVQAWVGQKLVKRNI